jgi:hypothetical protein
VREDGRAVGHLSFQIFVGVAHVNPRQLRE